MHPTLSTNQPLHFLLPPTHPPYEPLPYRSHQERQESGLKFGRPVPLSITTGKALSRDGLQTPPEEMTGTNLNPSRPPLPGSRVSCNGFFPKPYGLANDAGLGTLPGNGFTNANQAAVEHLRSNPQSPVARKDLSAPPEQLQRRKSSGGNNSIVSYLQIPSSINNSKGSLAEFAAQVRWVDGR